MSKRAFAKGAYIFYPGNPGLNTYLVETGEELVTNSRKLLMHIRSLVTLGLNGRLTITLLRLARLDENQGRFVDMPLSKESEK